MLAVSIAFARARAAEKGISLWLLLRREFFPTANDARRPSLFSNLINGGAHASNGLDIQEYMLVVRPGKNYADDVRLLISLYEELGKLLKKRAKGALPIGDEGGYDVSFKDNFEPIEILGKLITAKKIGKKCSIALDAAATEFSSGKGKYKLGGKAYASSALLEEYASWFKRSKHLCSIEDPFAENEDEAFALLQKRLKEKWVVADDLTTTDPSRIRMLGERKAIGGVIVKPNQIGTVSESCDAITEARAKGVRVIVSHRSGETEDAFIISLARASAADGVKIGAPARERVSKFNELIRLYGE
jgi:enolase